MANTAIVDAPVPIPFKVVGKIGNNFFVLYSTFDAEERIDKLISKKQILMPEGYVLRKHCFGAVYGNQSGGIQWILYEDFNLQPAVFLFAEEAIDIRDRVIHTRWLTIENFADYLVFKPAQSETLHAARTLVKTDSIDNQRYACYYFYV